MVQTVTDEQTVNCLLSESRTWSSCGEEALWECNGAVHGYFKVRGLFIQ